MMSEETDTGPGLVGPRRVSGQESKVQAFAPLTASNARKARLPLAERPLAFMVAVAKGPALSKKSLEPVQT